MKITPLLLAQISGQSLFMAVIWIIAAALVFWLLHWLIGYVRIPEPFAKVARVILAVAAVIFLINVILGIVGRPFIRW